MLGVASLCGCCCLLLLLTSTVSSTCIYTDTTVSCVNNAFTDVSVLQHLDDKFESVTFTGNSLNVLNQSLFGSKLMTRLLHLDLSNNSIQHIDSDVFQSAVNLVNLTMTHNNWRTNSSMRAIFNPLSNLLHLDLRAAFMTTYKDYDSKEQMNFTAYHVTNLESLFDGSHLSRLLTLHLEDNGLLSCPRSVFVNMSSLRELWLTGNSLVVLDIDHRMFANLHSLQAGNNEIKSLSSDVISNLVIMNFNQSLRLVNISNNPFECSCYTRLFIKWLQLNISNSFVVERNKLLCVSSSNQLISSVDLRSVDETPCRRQADSVYRVSYVVVGLLLGSAVVFVVLCLILRNRPDRSMQSHSHYSPVHS